MLQVLLPRGLSALLEIAKDDLGDPSPKVHSLNCLRHVFNDKTLTVDASAFFAAGICASVNALHHTHWGVRNSAALCFTALNTRMFGYKNDASCAKTLSVTDFFAR